MDQSKFEKEIWPYRSEMYRVALHVGKNEEMARDAVQEVLIRAWKKSDQWEHISNKRAFLLKSVRNEVLDRLKKPNKVIPLENLSKDYPSGDMSGEEQKAIKSSFTEQVKKAIKELPEKQSTTMMLRDIEGYDMQEIAYITGMNEGTIRVNLSRGRQKVKKTLINKEIFEDGTTTS